MTRSSRSVWVLVSACALVVGVAALATARTTAVTLPGSRLSCLDLVTAAAPSSTTSRTWTDVPGMRLSDRLALNFAVQLSGTFEGGDVQLRVLDATVGGTFSLQPRATTIRVGAGPAGGSFTWVGSNPSEHRHVFRLQWRLPSEGSATMTGGAMTLSYLGAPTPAAC